jgi:DNA-directed RNA polymerase subunit D
MQLKFLFKDKEKYYFLAEGFSPEQINSLRRIIIEEVPTMAIEEVYISENQSALYDEQLALRLGLIPLKTDLSYNFRNECSCGGSGCSLCEVKFKLEIEGKGYSYSKDLKSSDPNVVPVYDNIPIVYLEEGQKIKLEAIAIMGKGKDHSKWTPAHVYFFEFPKVEFLDKSLNLKEEDLIKNGLENLVILERERKIKLNFEKNKYIFVIEPFGQLNVEDILDEAIGELISKFEEFKEKFEKAISGKE